MQQFRVTQSEADHCFFFCNSALNLGIDLIVYVDGIVITGSGQDGICHLNYLVAILRPMMGKLK